MPEGNNKKHPIQNIRSVGPKIAESLSNLGIYSDITEDQFDVIYKEGPQIFNLNPSSTLLFSKEVTNRYPKEGEIIVLLR